MDGETRQEIHAVERGLREEIAVARSESRADTRMLICAVAVVMWATLVLGFAVIIAQLHA
jgi:hypothetical protein